MQYVLASGAESIALGGNANDSIIIVDECQNMNFHELDSVITRMGENCLILFCGDFRQSDFRWKDEKDGVLDFMKIEGKSSSIGKVFLKTKQLFEFSFVQTKGYIY